MNVKKRHVAELSEIFFEFLNHEIDEFPTFFGDSDFGEEKVQDKGRKNELFRRLRQVHSLRCQGSKVGIQSKENC